MYINNFAVNSEEDNGRDINNILSKFVYYDENNNKINNLEVEFEEQVDAFKYINEDDIVLELGGRYGTVSTAISYIQKHNGNLVVMEPDSNIINALEQNKIRNNANFTIINKYISK